MEIQTILNTASQVIEGLRSQIIPVLDIAKPPDVQYAGHLAKVISKLSPLVGNMIEFSIASLLNNFDWPQQGHWIRQDPGFPDLLFESALTPKPGIEIKTWFPLATEITARFKDSSLHFQANQTNVAIIAWLPEAILYGKPQILDVCIDSAKSFADARDKHYHRPPWYLVIEPEDTRSRTVNLQQTNTNGYVFQGTSEELQQAQLDIASWGTEGVVYSPSLEYQRKLRYLLGRYAYRLDTNFGKIDRIQHVGLEEFKTRMLRTEILGRTIQTWASRNLLRREDILCTLLEV
jgi:hypothetical protein